MTPSLSSTADMIRKTATPALFARQVSQGKWQMAKHLVVLDRALMAVARGSIKRLIVELPPRHGKSELVSKHFPAWYLGTYPDKQIILASATDDLAGDFGVAARDLLAEHGRAMFGQALRGDMQSRHRWQLEAGGGLRAAGVGTSIFGRGADLLLVDDYYGTIEQALSERERHKVHQWFMATASSRLSPDGAIIIVATRYHPKDLIGSLMEEAKQGGDRYVHIRLSATAEANDPMGRAYGDALWPDRFDVDWLLSTKAKYKASGYEWMWEALYQQNPPEVLDAEFDPAYFKDDIWFDQWPAEDDTAWRVIALDPSLGKTDKADYSAFTMLAGGHDGQMYVDADIQRRDKAKIVSAAMDNCRWFRPQVFGCEANQFQALLADDIDMALKREQFYLAVKGVYNTHSKIERIRGLTEYFARGRIKFRRGSPGAALLVEQLKGFPTCKYDDGPDSLEMAVRLIQHAAYGGLDEPEIQEPSFGRVYA